jgi:phenylpyruvate tautomerase PptA (4-oxalocrotonate tautomerase family)
MPVYEFIAPAGAATLDHKAEIARAVTQVHSELTGAPARYVHCSFSEAPRGSMFVDGAETTSPRMMGLIRAGRPEELRAHLIHGIADAWSRITGDAKDELSIFLYEVPGANCFEYGSILPEASQDAAPAAGGA